MEIKVGEYDVYQNGTIIGIEDEPIDFIFIKEIGFIIRLAFKNDETVQGSQIFTEMLGDKGGLLTFCNFNNALGIGNDKPIFIGHINNRTLYFNYRIYSLDKGGKTLHFTWLLGKEVENVKSK